MEGRRIAPFEFGKGNLKKKWDSWIKDFEWFLQANGKQEADDLVKIGQLMCKAGVEAQALFETFNLSTANAKKYDKVKEAFEEYCNPRLREMFERHQFRQLHQMTSQEMSAAMRGDHEETVDQFLSRIKSQARNCDFTIEGKNYNQHMIRDQFIFGLLDNGEGGIVERIFREETMTLDMAVTMARASEASRAQMQLIRGKKEDSKTVDVIRRQSRKQGGSQYDCKKCGRRHGKQQCPAYGTTCDTCNKKNHWSSCCRNASKAAPTKSNRRDKERRRRQSKKVRAVDVDTSSQESDSDSSFSIEVIKVNSLKRKKQWVKNVRINGKSLPMKLDTGAEGNVISKATFKKIHPDKKVKRTRIAVQTYSGENLQVIGKTIEEVEYKGKIYPVEFFIIDHQNVQSILGVETCEDMCMVKLINELEVKEDIKAELNECDKNAGKMAGKHHITLDPTVKPVIHAPRRVPHAVKPKLKKELEKMEKKGIIKKVGINEPTDWVNSIVVVDKSDGGVRICLDPKDLNKAIKREHHPINTHEEVAAKLSGATHFSTIDAEKAFHQVELDEDSQKLLCFNTPFGRYKYLRLPMGISSASEVYQGKMCQALEGLEGVEVMMDDMLIWGRNEEEHDRRLKAALKRIKEANIKLNKAKCHIKKSRVKFLGHYYSADGVEIDAEKVKAVANMPSPVDREGIQRFLGMLNYLSRYIPNMSNKTAPIRELLDKDVEWSWTPRHDACMAELKKILCEAPVLEFYNPNEPLIIQVDASSKGIGCALIQKEKPVAYTSKALTHAQQQYAQIEKELLAIVVGCTKFQDYIIGRSASTVVQTDHKPLESIMRKPLHTAPARLQKMLIQLQRYPEIEVRYIKGKDMCLADPLSRAFLPGTESNKIDKKMEVNMLSTKPISSSICDELVKGTEEELFLLQDQIMQGWPSYKSEVPPECSPYWNHRDQLVCSNGLIFNGNKIVIPPRWRKEMLKRLHESHQGMVKTKQRARDIMYWPGINADIENMISKCSACLENQPSNPHDPLHPHEIPPRAWAKIGTDLFTYNGKYYIVAMDYYSKFIEYRKIEAQGSNEAIEGLKSIFTAQGIPEEVVSDNGPCYDSKEFDIFAQKWDFVHNKVSPRYARSNGQAESAVKIVKKFMKRAEDPQLALLEYNTTPIADMESSPSQVLNSRRLRTKVPIATSLLKPETQPNKLKSLKRKQLMQKIYHDRKALRRPSSRVEKDETVRVQHKGKWRSAKITETLPHKSYKVQLSTGEHYRRTRSHLKKTGEPPMKLAPPKPTIIDNYPVPLPTPTMDARPATTKVSTPKSPEAPTPKPQTPKVRISRHGRPVIRPNKLDL